MTERALIIFLMCPTNSILKMDCYVPLSIREEKTNLTIIFSLVTQILVNILIYEYELVIIYLYCENAKLSMHKKKL